jgi:hypothetical protein
MGQTMGGIVDTPAWTPLFGLAALATRWENSSRRRRVDQPLLMMPH